MKGQRGIGAVVVAVWAFETASLVLGPERRQPHYYLVAPRGSVAPGKRVPWLGTEQDERGARAATTTTQKEPVTALERMLFALQAYAAVHNGSLEVGNASFAVPSGDERWPSELWGMELGRAVYSARRLEAMAREDEAMARSRSRERRGTLVISEVSERRYPSLPRLSRTSWGKRLTAAGFDWGDSPRDRRYRLCLGALEAYASEHGDLVLPRNFRVPARPPYPPRLYGANLDRAVYSIKFYRDLVADYPDRQAELRALGFIWQRLQPEFNLILEALVAFKAVHGHLDVPCAFVVPYSRTGHTKNNATQSQLLNGRDDDDDRSAAPCQQTTRISSVKSDTTDAWPDATRGMPLGRLCAQIRSRHDFVLDARRWGQLDRLGFVWSGAAQRKATLAEALDAYKALRRDSAAEPPVAFVVPDDGDHGADKWPRHLRGYKLGRRFYDAQRRDGRRKEDANHRTDRNFDKVAKALAAFVRIYGHADVPGKFKVPRHDDAWPDECAGMLLGARVAQMRSNGHYVTGNDPRVRRRKQILDALGFRWTKIRPTATPRSNKPTGRTLSEGPPGTTSSSTSTSPLLKGVQEEMVVSSSSSSRLADED